MSRTDFDNDLDGLAKYLMSRGETHYPIGRSFPEPPPATCAECDGLIHPDDYDNPMPTLCRVCNCAWYDGHVWASDETKEGREVARCEVCGVDSDTVDADGWPIG